jgi:phage baseplate assembly protein W
MNLSGSIIDWPIRVDARGTIVTSGSQDDVIAQAIADIVETRRGERVMMPDYGIDDFVFAVQDFSYAHRLAAHLEEQILKYVPMVRRVRVTAETDEQGRAIANVSYVAVGTVNAPKNLVFPVWQYRGQ